MNSKQILIFESSHAITNFLLKQWTEMAQEAIADHNKFMVALSGGQSPVEFYSRLSNLREFNVWEKTYVFQVDERFVPKDDPRNNFRSIRENLLQFVNIPANNIFPIETDCENVAVSASLYAQQLAAFFRVREKGRPPAFDFVLLGLGDDGHTASLFPDEELTSRIDILTVPVSSPQLPEERVSITLPVINNAKNVAFLVLGERKAEIVKSIFEDKKDYPASRIQPTDGRLTYLLDSKAARLLNLKDKFTHSGEAIVINLNDETKNNWTNASGGGIYL